MTRPWNPLPRATSWNFQWPIGWLQNPKKICTDFSKTDGVSLEINAIGCSLGTGMDLLNRHGPYFLFLILCMGSFQFVCLEKCSSHIFLVPIPRNINWQNSSGCAIIFPLMMLFLSLNRSLSSASAHNFYMIYLSFSTVPDPGLGYFDNMSIQVLWSISYSIRNFM